MFSSDNELGIVLCLTRLSSVEVNQNTSLWMWTRWGSGSIPRSAVNKDVLFFRPSYYDNYTGSTTLRLQVQFEHENIVDGDEFVSTDDVYPSNTDLTTPPLVGIH